jgi:uncharacterized protein YyaL (SSP411 family)
MGGLEVRRKPIQDSPTPGSNSVAALALDRLYAYTADARYHQAAHATLEAFAGIASQFGLFAATYGLASVLHSRHTIQVIITGADGDPRAKLLEEVAASVYRFGKAILRVTPERASQNTLPTPILEIVPGLRPAEPQALVCIETTCQPPTSDATQLASLLTGIVADAASR